MARPTKLTPEAQKGITSMIRAGAYDWVAAQANGVGPRTFYTWMSKGAKARTGKFRQFQQEVCQAKAEARVAAEIAVRKDSPFNWLRYGPGRERPGEPGWTDQVQYGGLNGAAVGEGDAEHTGRAAGNLAALLGETINQVRSGQLDPKIASTVSSLAVAALKALEQTEILERLLALESIVKDRPREAGSIFDADPGDHDFAFEPTPQQKAART